MALGGEPIRVTLDQLGDTKAICTLLLGALQGLPLPLLKICDFGKHLHVLFYACVRLVWPLSSVLNGGLNTHELCAYSMAGYSKAHFMSAPKSKVRWAGMGSCDLAAGLTVPAAGVFSWNVCPTPCPGLCAGRHACVHGTGKWGNLKVLGKKDPTDLHGCGWHAPWSV